MGKRKGNGGVDGSFYHSSRRMDLERGGQVLEPGECFDFFVFRDRWLAQDVRRTRVSSLLHLEIVSSSRLKLGNEIGEGAGNHGAPIKNNAKFRESRRHFLSRNSARTSGAWPRLKSN